MNDQSQLVDPNLLDELASVEDIPADNPVVGPPAVDPRMIQDDLPRQHSAPPAPYGLRSHTGRAPIDEPLVVHWKPSAVPDASQGKGKFRNVIEIKVITAGGKTESVKLIKYTNDNKLPEDHPVFKRFPDVYQAILKGEQVALQGYPLDRWTELQPAMVRQLKAAEIYTVEQLAALSDDSLQYVGMGAAQLRDKAKQFIESISGNEAQIDALKKQLTELQARLDAQETPKKRGRPPKQQETQPNETITAAD